jgi:hypothetical protein
MALAVFQQTTLPTFAEAGIAEVQNFSAPAYLKWNVGDVALQLEGEQAALYERLTFRSACNQAIESARVGSNAATATTAIWPKSLESQRPSRHATLGWALPPRG